MIGALDANKDNQVSKEELLAGVEKQFIGKTVETVPGIINNNNDNYSFILFCFYSFSLL